MLGLFLFISQFPTFILSLFGGVVSDRYNRFHLLFFTQSASLLQAASLAVLILTGCSNVWLLLLLAFLLGCVNAFDIPIRHGLIYDLIDNKDHLPNGIALNASMVNLARVIGPAIAGILLGRFGPGVCFLLNATSFIAVLLSLLHIKIPQIRRPPSPSQKMTDGIKEGFTYVIKSPSIRKVILLQGITNLLVTPYTALLPVYAKVVYNGTATTFGSLESFIGLGAIIGTCYLLSTGTGANRLQILKTSIFLFAAALICFSLSRHLYPAMGFALLSGFAMMTQATTVITIIQSSVAPEMRGRTMSYLTLCYFGLMPLGTIIICTISAYIGPAHTTLLQGLAALTLLLI
jgi:MFS family permease